MEKKSLKSLLVLLVSCLFLASFQLVAQDVVTTNPDKAKLLNDTLGVRMIKVTMEPGQGLVLHTHPAHMLYCLEGGEVTVSFSNGKKEVMTMKPGDAIQAPAETPHTTKNTGKTKISFVLVEIAEKKM